MNRVLGVIPARLNSTRLPGKVLLPIHGKPLIQWVVERTLQARRLTEVLVAVDDVQVQQALAGVDVEVVMTRSDHPSGTDRIAEAIEGRDCDAVINVQGDEPMISPTLIDKLADTILAGDSEMATAVTPIQSEEDRLDPSVVKVVLNNLDQAMYFSRSPIPYVREPEDEAIAVFWRHIGMYAYKTDFLRELVTHPAGNLEQVEKLEQLRALQLGARIQAVITDDVGLGVDCPEDLERVKEAMVQEGMV
jgi:3-deoxy-manno-octulosonate cytidylyltransferase (CMP-KDO synthetase)